MRIFCALFFDNVKAAGSRAHVVKIEWNIQIHGSQESRQISFRVDLEAYANSRH